MAADHESRRVIVRPRVAGVPLGLGSPVLPGSKSHAQRALILAGLGAGVTRIENVPDSADVQVMRAAIEALGANVERDGAAWRVRAAVAMREARIDCCDNGTALRMLTMVVGLLGGRAWFDGSMRLRQRPMGEARVALQRMGVVVGDEWPLLVDGRAAGGWSDVEVAARDTSQVVSGALLALACRSLRGDTRAGAVLVAGPIRAAASYWDITTAVLTAFGVSVDGGGNRAAGDGLRARINGVAAGPRTARYVVPPDASAATFVAALAALHGREMPAWPTGDGHPDWRAVGEIASLAAALPGEVWRSESLALLPDSFPAMCVVAAGREGRTELRGAPALRHKESDRVAAMAAALSALGVACEEFDDGVVIVGRALRAIGGTAPVCLPAPGDHRIVMALCLLGTVILGGVAVDHRDAVGKSWPSFFGWLGGVAEVG